MAYIKIIDSDLTPSEKYIMANSVTVSGSKNTDETPDVNIQDNPVEVQTQSFENFKYTVSGVHYTNATGTLTWDDVITLYKKRYNGTNYSILNIAYGNSNWVYDTDNKAYGSSSGTYELMKTKIFTDPIIGVIVDSVAVTVQSVGGSYTSDVKAIFYYSDGTNDSDESLSINDGFTTSLVNPDKTKQVYKLEIYSRIDLGVSLAGFDKTVIKYKPEILLKGLSGSSDIKVVLKTPNLPISVTDSKDGYMPIGSLNFIETG